MNIEIRPIKDIRTARYNPRKISDGQLVSLKQSIERFGFVDPVIVNDRTGVLVGGHQRIKAAKELGLKQVPVVAVNLDEAEEKALNVALNKISGEWDLDLLRGVLEDVQAGGLELSLTGFTDEEWSAMSGMPGGIAGLTDPDEVPEPPEETETVTQPGDLWLLGDHRLLCGDSTNSKHVERLMDGQKADMVFTDPPYGVAYKPKATAGKGRSVSSARLEGCANDLIANDATLEQAYEIAQQALALHQTAQAHFVCCDWKSYAMMQRAVEQAGIKQKACIVWDKGGPYQYMDKYSKGHEFIIYAGPFGGEKTVSTDIWSFPREFRPDHPTPKPVDLICNALSHFPSLTTVVDVFGGSGATLIACEKTSRHCRMMELDPAYCDVIVKRWEQFTGKKAVRDAG